MRLSVTHPDHPSFFVRKLWSYFVAGDPDAATQRALEQLYVSSGRAVRPVVDGDPQASRSSTRAAGS